MWFAAWYGRVEVAKLLSGAGASSSAVVTSGVHTGLTPHTVAERNPLGKPGCTIVAEFLDLPRIHNEMHEE